MPDQQDVSPRSMALSTLVSIDSRTTKLGAELGVVDLMAWFEEKSNQGRSNRESWEALQTDGHLDHL